MNNEPFPLCQVASTQERSFVMIRKVSFNGRTKSGRTHVDKCVLPLRRKLQSLGPIQQMFIHSIASAKSLPFAPGLPRVNSFLDACRLELSPEFTHVLVEEMKNWTGNPSRSSPAKSTCWGGFTCDRMRQQLVELIITNVTSCCVFFLVFLPWQEWKVKTNTNDTTNLFNSRG